MTHVTVIVPCFDAGNWIGEAIESALSQDYPDIDILVVDDGSTDGSASVVKAFKERVTYVWQPNMGPCAARNHGLRLARGPLIQFLDADDVLHIKRISSMLGAWESKPDAEFVAASYVTFNAAEMSGQAISKEELAISNPDLRSEPLSVDYLPWAGFFKKQFLESIGPWDETLTRWVDLEYHARIAVRCKGSFLYIDQPLYGYRQHDGPRISGHNKTFTKLDEGLKSVTAARVQFESTNSLNDASRRWLFPCYVQLARGYARAGDREKFIAMLHLAVSCTARVSFGYKARAAEYFARMFGAHTTSRVLDRVLPSA